MNDNKVIDFSIISKMSDITSEYARWKKQLWKNDRKLYNKLKYSSKLMEHNKETLTYAVMMSNEVYVSRALSILEDIKKCLTYDLQYNQEFISPLLDRVNSLSVLIEMTDHKTSIFHS